MTPDQFTAFLESIRSPETRESIDGILSAYSSIFEDVTPGVLASTRFVSSNSPNGSMTDISAQNLSPWTAASDYFRQTLNDMQLDRANRAKGGSRISAFMGPGRGSDSFNQHPGAYMSSYSAGASADSAGSADAGADAGSASE